jgi:anti-anti-sigma factor
VEFLASVGLSELIELAARCTKLGSRLIVVAAHSIVLRYMELTGLTANIPVAASVDDALATSTNT